MVLNAHEDPMTEEQRKELKRLCQVSCSPAPERKRSSKNCAESLKLTNPDRTALPRWAWRRTRPRAFPLPTETRRRSPMARRVPPGQ